MLKNYFKIALRNLWHYKVYSWISLIGFSIGMVSVILLFFYINGELSYDNFHKNGDKIYRILRTNVSQSGEYTIGVSSPPFAPALQTDFEGMIESTMRVDIEDALVKYEDKSFVEKKFCIADPHFFEFFSFPLVRGDAKEVLSQVNAIVISEEIAQKYFGREDPLGKILEIDQEDRFVVTGIMKNHAQKSHLDFDFVASMRIFENADWFKNWRANGLNTYIQLKNPDQSKQLEAQFPEFMQKHLGDLFKNRGYSNGLVLEPLTGIYFASDTQYDDMVLHGNRQTINILTAVSLAIFIIVCFNYINLTTAISFKRSKEMGIRRVLGASIQELLRLLSSEFIILILVACVVASPLAYWFMNSWLQDFAYRTWINPVFFVIAGLGALLIAFGSIAFQTWNAVHINPADILREE